MCQHALAPLRDETQAAPALVVLSALGLRPRRIGRRAMDSLQLGGRLGCRSDEGLDAFEHPVDRSELGEHALVPCALA